MVVLELVGIFIGNCLWLLGLAGIGVGIWLARTTPESTLKLVGFLSLLGPGRAETFGDRLTRLVQPTDRTTRTGIIAIIIGIALIAAGCLLIKISA